MFHRAVRCGSPTSGGSIRRGLAASRRVLAIFFHRFVAPRRGRENYRFLVAPRAERKSLRTRFGGIIEIGSINNI